MNRRNVIILAIGGFIAAYFFTRNTSINKTLTTTVKKGGKVILDRSLKFVNTISDYGKQLIRNIETLQLKVYNDSGGFSIGYGHYLGKTATIHTINETQADQYFNQDIANVESEIKKYISVGLTQNQHDALVSFFYNVGHKGFINADGSKTQILQALNRGDFVGAAAQFDRWTHSQGVVNTSLKNRRNAEKALFLS